MKIYCDEIIDVVRRLNNLGKVMYDETCRLKGKNYIDTVYIDVLQMIVDDLQFDLDKLHKLVPSKTDSNN